MNITRILNHPMQSSLKRDGNSNKSLTSTPAKELDNKIKKKIIWGCPNE